jgi:hypothetical protein
MITYPIKDVIVLTIIGACVVSAVVFVVSDIMIQSTKRWCRNLKR